MYQGGERWEYGGGDPEIFKLFFSVYCLVPMPEEMRSGLAFLDVPQMVEERTMDSVICHL